MADDTRKRGGEDRSRVNVHQEHELRDWARHFDVTLEELKQAVGEVGTQAATVEQYLRARRLAP